VGDTAPHIVQEVLRGDKLVCATCSLGDALRDTILGEVLRGKLVWVSGEVGDAVPDIVREEIHGDKLECVAATWVMPFLI